MSFTVRAISLDLDDTLWPFAPIGARIEQVLHDWFEIHSPRTAALFPVATMRDLRAQVFAEHPHLLHDMSALRRMTLQRALEGSDADMALLEPAYETFYAARNRVDFYPDALDALQRIARRVPLASLSNGNADLQAIGIGHLFSVQMHSRAHGAAKPEKSIFLATCEQLGLPPGDVLHVGDHVDADVCGAARAGLRSCWLHRDDHPGGLQAWPHDDLQPDLQFDTLTALADWLESQPAA